MLLQHVLRSLDSIRGAMDDHIPAVFHFDLCCTRALLYATQVAVAHANQAANVATQLSRNRHCYLLDVSLAVPNPCCRQRGRLQRALAMLPGAGAGQGPCMRLRSLCCSGWQF